MHGNLFCEDCSARSCALENASLGKHNVPKTHLGSHSGYSEVILATPSTLPILQACVECPDVPDPDLPGPTKTVPFWKLIVALPSLGLWYCSGAFVAGSGAAACGLQSSDCRCASAEIASKRRRLSTAAFCLDLPFLQLAGWFGWSAIHWQVN